MWLVLCDARDLPALWAARGLAARRLAPVEIVTADLLATALRWEHEVSARQVGWSAALADGRLIRSAGLRGVLNRLQWAPAGQSDLAEPADRDYVRQELHAVALSWLAALPCPVLNPASPAGLCGARRHPAHWAWLAARAGLPVRPFQESDAAPVPWDRIAANGDGVRSVIALGGELHGPPVPAGLAEGCAALAAHAGTPLLGVTFAVEPGGAAWFAGATAMPDLRIGGEALLDALARELAPAGASGAAAGVPR
jgi:hypothetical protein